MGVSADVDRLELFGRTLQGARKKIYEVVCRRYRKSGKLRDRADQALGDVLAEFEIEGYAETQLDRETRAISALENVSKGARTWRVFYADWRTVLEEFGSTGSMKATRNKT